jgi:hypothetical protein
LKRPYIYTILTLTSALLLCASGCGGEGSVSTGAPEVTSTSSANATEVTLSPERLASLRARIDAWFELSESVQSGLEIKTSEIAAFLWPRAEAQEQAAEYGLTWSEQPDASQPIIRRQFDHIVRITPSDSVKGAVVLVANKLLESDASTTRGLDVVTWTYQEGQWYLTTSFWVPEPVDGGRQGLDKTSRTLGMTWSPISVEEVTTLSPRVADSKPGHVFLVVTVNVSNGGDTSDIPSAYSLSFYDGQGDELQTAAVFDTMFPGSAEARDVLIEPGMDEQLTYCLDVAEGLGLDGLQYEVKAVK